MGLFDWLFGVSSLLRAIESGDKEKAKALIRQGADVNQKARLTGATPLFAACIRNYQDIAELLLSRGADVNVRLSVGTTILHHMAKYSDNRSLDMVTYLLSKGAEIDIEDRQGRSSLHYVCENKDHTIGELLIRSGADTNKADRAGLTPLHISAYAGNAALVRLLLDKGANVNDANNVGGISPLHAAAAAGHAEITKLLLSGQADILAKDKEGHTPLQVVGTIHDSAHSATQDILRQAAGKGAPLRETDPDVAAAGAKQSTDSHEKVVPPPMPVAGASSPSRYQASRPRPYEVVRGWSIPWRLLSSLNTYSVVWFYRVFRELHRRKATDLSPGKAVGYMFIPLFNFVWVFIAWKKLGDAITKAYSQARLAPPATGVVWLPPISLFVVIGLTLAVPLAGFAAAVVLLSIALCTIQGQMNRLAAVGTGERHEPGALETATLAPAIEMGLEDAALPGWSPPSLAHPDEYERRCLTAEFHEQTEERTFRSDGAFAEVLAALNSRSFDDAIRRGTALFPRYRDFDLPWEWVSTAYQETGRLDLAYQVARDGLARAKRKSVLLTRLGDIEWQRGNLPEAVYALANVLHCYADRPLDYNPYLLLSYVAEGAGLPGVAAAFLRQVDRLRGGTVRLPAALADRLRGLSRKAQAPAIARVLEGLSEKYLSV